MPGVPGCPHASPLRARAGRSPSSWGGSGGVLPPGAPRKFFDFALVFFIFPNQNHSPPPPPPPVPLTSEGCVFAPLHRRRAFFFCILPSWTGVEKSSGINPKPLGLMAELFNEPNEPNERTNRARVSVGFPLVCPLGYPRFSSFFPLAFGFSLLFHYIFLRTSFGFR